MTGGRWLSAAVALTTAAPAAWSPAVAGLVSDPMRNLGSVAVATRTAPVPPVGAALIAVSRLPVTVHTIGRFDIHGGEPSGARYLDHVHSSSRYDRPVALLAAQARRFIARPAVDVITWTEVRERSRARVLHELPRWRTYSPAAADVAVSWHRRVWRPRLLECPQLTGSRYTTGRGTSSPSQRAAVAVLDRRRLDMRALVVVSHLPAGVEYGNSFRARPAVVSTWQAAVAGLHRLVAALRARWRPDLVLVVADWNTDVRRPAWRHRLREAFPALSPSWRRRALPDGGTHRGGRLIDATMTNGRGLARLLPDDRSSDHRPYAERLYTPRRES